MFASTIFSSDIPNNDALQALTPWYKFVLQSEMLSYPKVVTTTKTLSPSSQKFHYIHS